MLLLHPSQPLSHVARLILASLAPGAHDVSFRSTTPSGRVVRWADSTDVADFIRDASRAREAEALYKTLARWQDAPGRLHERVQAGNCIYRHAAQVSFFWLFT